MADTEGNLQTVQCLNSAGISCLVFDIQTASAKRWISGLGQAVQSCLSNPKPGETRDALERGSIIAEDEARYKDEALCVLGRIREVPGLCERLKAIALEQDRPQCMGPIIGLLREKGLLADESREDDSLSPAPHGFRVWQGMCMTRMCTHVWARETMMQLP